MNRAIQCLLLGLILIMSVSAMDYDPDYCIYSGSDYECIRYHCDSELYEDFGTYFYSVYMSYEDYTGSPFPNGWTERIAFDGDCPPENPKQFLPYHLEKPEVPEFSAFGIVVASALIGVFIFRKNKIKNEN